MHALRMDGAAFFFSIFSQISISIDRLFQTRGKYSDWSGAMKWAQELGCFKLDLGLAFLISQKPRGSRV